MNTYFFTEHYISYLNFLTICVLFLENKIITSKYKLKPEKLSRLINVILLIEYVTQLSRKCFTQAEGNTISTKVHWH